MLNICFWIIFGFLTGWTGALIKSHSETQAFAVATAGVCGGALGGALIQIVSRQQLIAAYNPESIVGATILAIIIVALTMLRGERQTS